MAPPREADGSHWTGSVAMKSIVGIGHVAIRVKDIDRTLDFYVGKLGFSEMMRIDRDGRLWLLYLRITDTQYLEVFPPALARRPLCEEQDRAGRLRTSGARSLPASGQGLRSALSGRSSRGLLQ